MVILPSSQSLMRGPNLNRGKSSNLHLYITLYFSNSLSNQMEPMFESESIFLIIAFIKKIPFTMSWCFGLVGSKGTSLARIYLDYVESSRNVERDHLVYLSPKAYQNSLYHGRTLTIEFDCTHSARELQSLTSRRDSVVWRWIDALRWLAAKQRQIKSYIVFKSYFRKN